MRRLRSVRVLCDALLGEPVATARWMDVLEFANEHLLTPALADSPALPDDARDYVVTLRRLNGERNATLRKQAIELVGTLNRRGIEPALLKGGLTLFDGPYRNPAQRMMRDLDLLVPVASRDAAIEALQSLGYSLARGYGTRHHAFGDFARPNDPGSVDLHTELVDPWYVLPAAEVWQRARLIEVDGVRFCAPSPTDRVLHNLLHAQVHHLGNYYRGDLPLQQVHELVALARHFGPAVDWRFIERRLAEHRLDTPLHSYLLAADRLFGLAWPLERRPALGARLHRLRCLLQIELRPLRWLGVPWGNLRGAFAWHRMRALHGDAGSALIWRCRHLVGYLRKRGISTSVGRLLRVD
jgi:hypothetical protein